METRSQLRKRKLEDDVKPIIKLAFYNGLIPENNSNVEFLKHDFKECCVDLKDDIKSVLKRDLYQEAKNKDMIKEEDIKSDLFKKCEKEPEFVPGKVQCFKCKNYYSEIGITRHSCGTFCCEKCGKSFTNRSKFESHLRQHAHIERRQRLFETTTCKICNKIERVAFMKRHLKIHRSRRTCGKCGIVLSNTEMKDHIKIHFKYTCDICGKKSQYQQNHDIHIKIHEKAKQHPCNECDASFQHLVELARHVTKAHRQIEDGKYECLFCKKTVFAISHHLRTHQIDHIKCDICNADLRNKSALKEHIRHHKILMKAGNDRAITPRYLIEKNTVPLNCSGCVKKFTSKSQLILHYKTHKISLPYPCPLCDLDTFQSKLETIKHMSLIHLSMPISHEKFPISSTLTPDIENPLITQRVDECECDICDMTFVNGKEYWKHYNRRHRLKKPGKTMLHILMKKYSIPKRNMRTIKCFTCHERVRISHLNSHIASHQSFKCILCHKVFFDQNKLESHEITHDRFSQRCPVCTLSFLTHIRLMAHLKMYHKVAFSASRACSRCYILF